MIRPQLILFNRSFTTAERAGGIFFGECDFKMKNAVDFENLNVFDFALSDEDKPKLPNWTALSPPSSIHEPLMAPPMVKDRTLSKFNFTMEAFFN